MVNEVPPSKRGIAMVFQSYALYPHMSVYENISFALENQKVPRDEIKKRVEKVAEMLQLTPYLTRLPKALSGGQRQRVAIGRAIVRGAKVFLFDEPLSNLDAALRVATRMEIAKLKRDMPETTMIYVTHDQVEAMTLADRIVVLQAGRVEQVGTPMELYERPGNLFRRGLHRFAQDELHHRRTRRQGQVQDAGRAPRASRHRKQGWCRQHRRQGGICRDFGQRQFYLCGDEHGLITARENGRTTVKTGDTVYLTPQAGQTHRFDDNGKRLDSK